MQQYALYPQRRLLKAPIAQDLPETAERLRCKLRHCKQLIAKKVPWEEVTDIVGIAKSTYYRIAKKIATVGILGFTKQSTKPKKVRQSQVPQHVRDLVLRLRLDNPTYGKSKIVVLLRRDHAVQISESTVGRIISKLLADRKIVKSASASRPKRKRNFTKGHAQRLRYGMKATAPGELVQIDHMTVTINSLSFKHFQAWDPITKVIVAKATHNATSAAAAKFLQQVIQEMPAAVKSVQVDGGSEFMKDFETGCAKLKIPLYVLPPKRPQWNGGVERSNRTFREEFYSMPNFLCDSVGAINAELQKAVRKYNSYRPHFSLKGSTPYEYNSAQLLAA